MLTYTGGYRAARDTRRGALILCFSARQENTLYDPDRTALQYAVIKGSTAMVQRLLVSGADHTIESRVRRLPRTRVHPSGWLLAGCLLLTRASVLSGITFGVVQAGNTPLKNASGAVKELLEEVWIVPNAQPA